MAGSLEATSLSANPKYLSSKYSSPNYRCIFLCGILFKILLDKNIKSIERLAINFRTLLQNVLSYETFVTF